MALFDFLKGEGQAIVYIKSAIQHEIPVETLIETLQMKGLKIRESLTRQVYDYLGTTIRSDTQYIKFLQLNALPNVARIPVALTQTLRNYSYQGVAQGFLRGTNIIVSKPLSISTNVLLTKQEAADLIAEIATGPGADYDLESAVVDITGIFQNPMGLVEA
jgi:hypothetical protein